MVSFYYNNCIKCINTVNAVDKTEKGRKEMIILDYKDRRPLYEQIAEKFQELIVKGILPKDMQMPSVRSQAMQLSINPNTIQRAYSELEHQGYIYTIKGKGSFVADISSFLDGKKVKWRGEMEKLVEEGYAIGILQEEMIALVQKNRHQENEQNKGGMLCD